MSLYFSFQTKNSREVLWNGTEGLSEKGDCPQWIGLLILIMSSLILTMANFASARIGFATLLYCFQAVTGNFRDGFG